MRTYLKKIPKFLKEGAYDLPQLQLNRYIETIFTAEFEMEAADSENHPLYFEIRGQDNWK